MSSNCAQSLRGLLNLQKTSWDPLEWWLMSTTDRLLSVKQFMQSGSGHSYVCWSGVCNQINNLDGWYDIVAQSRHLTASLKTNPRINVKMLLGHYLQPCKGLYGCGGQLVQIPVLSEMWSWNKSAHSQACLSLRPTCLSCQLNGVVKKDVFIWMEWEEIESLAKRSLGHLHDLHKDTRGSLWLRFVHKEINLGKSSGSPTITTAFSDQWKELASHLE